MGSTSAEYVQQKRALGKPELTAYRLRSLLDYDKDTGEFKWLVSRGGSSAGDIAGSITSAGYVSIFIDYWSFRANRVAWLHVTGEWPESGLVVDHKNWKRADNRWDNLQLLTTSQNSRRRSPEHVGVTGESNIYPSGNSFRVQIEYNGERHGRGGFKCVEDAVAERCDIEKHLFGSMAEKIRSAEQC